MNKKGNSDCTTPERLDSNARPSFTLVPHKRKLWCVQVQHIWHSLRPDKSSQSNFVIASWSALTPEQDKSWLSVFDFGRDSCRATISRTLLLLLSQAATRYADCKKLQRRKALLVYKPVYPVHPHSPNHPEKNATAVHVALLGQRIICLIIMFGYLRARSVNCNHW